MPLKIYNSLTRQKESFVPLNDSEVRLYSCGVTVYDRCHIGHARSLYVMEVIRRYLQYRGYKVHFVRNITDVDDKIIKKANETGRTFDAVVKENIALYEHDLELLGIPKADEEPRATENIGIMIAHIQGLMEKGYAYAANGDVYFRVRKFKDYGKLSGQGQDKMLEAVRIEKDEKKEDPLDFALWKKSKEGEPSWPSPWGAGRPGWHIECSCMSMKYLKAETLDIHAGGQDLIFPHHENEIAQSEALTGKPFVRYWVHNGLLTINGQKMAKSLGNFITIEHALKQWAADDLKLFFLSSHYASAIDYNQGKLSEAKKQKGLFYEFFDKVNTWPQIEKNQGLKVGMSEKDKTKIVSLTTRFQEAMDDDFNTPQTLAGMFELVDLGAWFISANKAEGFNEVKKTLEEYFEIFGLQAKPKLEIPQEVKKLIQEREKAKKEKDFKKADNIREEIKIKFHMATIDTGYGVVFSEVSE